MAELAMAARFLFLIGCGGCGGIGGIGGIGDIGGIGTSLLVLAKPLTPGLFGSCCIS